jgi:hypothetical protein
MCCEAMSGIKAAFTPAASNAARRPASNDTSPCRAAAAAYSAAVIWCGASCSCTNSSAYVSCGCSTAYVWSLQQQQQQQQQERQCLMCAHSQWRTTAAASLRRDSSTHAQGMSVIHASRLYNTGMTRVLCAVLGLGRCWWGTHPHGWHGLWGNGTTLADQGAVG